MRGTTSNCRKPTQFERNSAFFLIYWDDTEKLFLLLFESGFDEKRKYPKFTSQSIQYTGVSGDVMK